MKNIRRLAQEMLDMCDELQSLRVENHKLRAENEEHRKFLYESVKSGEQQMVNWIDLLTSDRIQISALGQESKQS